MFKNRTISYDGELKYLPVTLRELHIHLAPWSFSSRRTDDNKSRLCASLINGLDEIQVKINTTSANKYPFPLYYYRYRMVLFIFSVLFFYFKTLYTTSTSIINIHREHTVIRFVFGSNNICPDFSTGCNTLAY